MNIFFRLTTALLLCTLTLHSETDERLHADGKGWRLDQAKVTDPTRPRVLLVGDSILNGYFSVARKALENCAYVDAWVNPYPQSKHYTKLFAEVIDKGGPYDVIHFNTGLHGWQKGRIPEGQIEPLTHEVVQMIRTKNPKTKVIWASSTPVTTRTPAPIALDPEINPVIIGQNQSVANVMKAQNVPVNDFYTMLVTTLEDARGDQFHWKQPAYQKLGKACADSIKKALEK